MRPKLFEFTRFVFYLFLIINGVNNDMVKAQTSAPPHIFSDSVYSKTKIISDIEYGKNYNHFYNDSETLLLDIYEPDTVVNYRRPLLIYSHGGGFTAGDKVDNHAQTLGGYFGKRGYILASINYRLGIEPPGDTTSNYETVYQATQDAKSAVRFFKKYADQYCIDTGAIFLTGTSAGAALSLVAAYWDQAEANPFFNTSTWGPLDQSSGNEGYSSNVKAVVSCWGGMPDTSWLRGETIPNQLFHGNLDSTIPYTDGIGASGLFTYGSFDIHDACVRNRTESYLHTFWGFGHGVADASPQFDTLEQISLSFIFEHLNANEGEVRCDTSIAIIDSAPNDINIFPNPSDGHISLRRENFDRNLTIELFDVSGKLIKSGSAAIAAFENFQFDFTNLESGLYFARIADQSGIHLYKVIINKN